MVAELWGAWEGLKSAWKKGYRRVELQIDALAMVKALKKEVTVHTQGWNL
ncbi:hypothetical protein A2U01_0101123, partial [Trifolium medium]|nr:hypothetical protein [Trifolium medium]